MSTSPDSFPSASNSGGRSSEAKDRLARLTLTDEQRQTAQPEGKQHRIKFITAAGLVLGAFIALVPMNVPYVAAAHISLGWNEIIGALVMSILIGLFGGLLPAIQAARLRIVDALSS